MWITQLKEKNWNQTREQKKNRHICWTQFINSHTFRPETHQNQPQHFPFFPANHPHPNPLISALSPSQPPPPSFPKSPHNPKMNPHYNPPTLFPSQFPKSSHIPKMNPPPTHPQNPGTIHQFPTQNPGEKQSEHMCAWTRVWKRKKAKPEICGHLVVYINPRNGRLFGGKKREEGIKELPVFFCARNWTFSWE